MRVHFIGIGGIGLSALARFMQHSGHEVSGSDIKESPVTKELKKEGIKVNIPQDASAIKSHDLVIYSAAVLNSNCEVQEAKKQKLLLLPRKDALSIIMQKTTNYCICAAHGKSTTTAILSSILQSSALIGAISKEFGSNFRYIDKVLAFEADESDESFILSHPYCSIVLNTEPEHMEYYNYDKKKFYAAYKEFLDIAKLRVINAEDDFLKDYKKYSIKLYPSKDISNIKYELIENEPYTSFELKDFGEFKIWGFGEHIALNGSAAILAANQTLSIDMIKQNLLNYKGIKKRFDILQKYNNFVVIDDYAHHPTEIKATIKSIQIYKKFTEINKIIIIWQPHKYSRTLDNLEAFRRCFLGCDELIILPVWSVNEEPQTIDFTNLFSYYNITLAHSVKTTNGKIEVIKDGTTIKSIQDGLVLGVGAGDITYQLRY